MQPSLFRDHPKRIRRFLTIAVVLGILGVVGYRVAGVLIPPRLIIAEPRDQLSTSSRLITIRGVTVPGAEVRINGRAVAPDARGEFATEVVLAPGPNTIELEARRRHGFPTRIRRVIEVVTTDAPVADRSVSPRAALG